MPKPPMEPALLPSMIVTGLLTWGTWKSWEWMRDSAQLVPIILGLLAVGSGMQSLTLSLSALYNWLLRSEARARSENKGSASWATSKDIEEAGLSDTKGVFLGCDLQGKPLFFDGETHGLTLAPAGTGKTVSMAVPALCHLSVPMIVTDLKGTLACMTKDVRQNQHRQKTYCVNPAHLFEEILGTPARYNPLQILMDDWVDPNGHKNLIADAQSLALQLHPEPPRASGEPFWRQGTRKVLVFVLVYLVTQREGKNGTLSAALVLLRNVQQLKEACYLAACSDVLNGELADMAVDLLTKLEASDTRQVESFLEGATQSLAAFSPSGWLAESTSTCDFGFKDLKDKAATVYLIADPTKMQVFAPWLGVLGWAAITELTRCQNTNPVLLLLDEATNFRINNISNALTGLREFGIRCWFLIQELEEWVKNEGREGLETLLSQTEVKQIFGVQSQRTAELVSRMCGEETVKSVNYSLGHVFEDKVQHSMTEQARRLVTPDEVRRFADTILFVRNLPPIHAIKTGYHEVKPWADWVVANPLFGRKLKGKIRVWLRYPRTWWGKQ